MKNREGLPHVSRASPLRASSRGWSSEIAVPKAQEWWSRRSGWPERDAGEGWGQCRLRDAFGAYTTVRLYPEDRLTVIPDGVTDDQAASSLLKGLTARYLLKETVQLHEGDTVLYHAAAGGVGQIFTQWARSLGIHVIGTVSTADKAQIALQVGCTAVVNYSTEDEHRRTTNVFEPTIRFRANRSNIWRAICALSAVDT